MITYEILNTISNDFGSTFTLVDANTLTNLLYAHEQKSLEIIMKKHLKDVKIEFKRTFQLSKEPEGKDVWIIKIYANSKT